MLSFRVRGTFHIQGYDVTGLCSFHLAMLLEVQRQALMLWCSNADICVQEAAFLFGENKFLILYLVTHHAGHSQVAF